MLREVSDIAQELIDLIRIGGNHAITIPWSDMYEICGRKRLRDSFMEYLEQELRDRAYSIHYGVNTIWAFRDANVYPVTSS